MKTDLELEIIELKKKHNALILAHYYEDGDIQDIADHVGDSLFLAQKGQENTADVILLAGVVFMAESVKILSPTKTVLVPDMNAGCSLVTSSPIKDYRAWKEAHPNSVLVSYINCSAEAKTVSDIICTSSNAEKIIAAIPKDKKILFGPDKNLGNFLKKKTGRDMEIWQGYCEVHVKFHAEELYKLISKNPEDVVIAHPECDEEVLNYASVIGSTSRLLEEVKNNPAKKFIVATEDGIFHQMRKLRPDAELIQAPDQSACNCTQCPYMKLNNLEKIRNALRDLKPQVHVDTNVIEKARVSLDRMMKVSRDEAVTF
ncbi:MAG: quinolinate synthase NadA [Bdellovibrionales bacterium]|nr:quinolinate synthase NadA [Bdellovibrionales bacterium]